MKIIAHNQWLSILLLVALGAPLGGCGLTMAQAKQKLEANGMTSVELTPREGGGFDFTGTKNGQKCSGTIQGEASPVSESETIDSTCGGQ
jgi:hypothetical protein